MGTNYYFVNKKDSVISKQDENKLKSIVNEFKNKLQDSDYYLNSEMEYQLDEMVDNLKSKIRIIHIGKSSAGWKPLFQVQEEYNNVNEMKRWYDLSSNEWIIKDEYGEELSWEQLEKWLLNWESIRNCRTHVDGSWSSAKIIDGYEFYDGEFS